MTIAIFSMRSLGGFTVCAVMRLLSKRGLAVTLAALMALLAFSVLPSGLQGGQGQATEQPAVKRQILAIGGGGGQGMMKYFLAMTGKKTPRVCYMATATGDPKASMEKWVESMKKSHDCDPRIQRMFVSSDQLQSFEDELLAADAIYVGGGNTLNMIAIWKAQGVDKILRKAWEKGTVLGGGSAGSICWFEQGSTDSRPGTLTPMDCLGFLKGSNVPHYDGEKQRRPLFQDWVKKGEIMEGLAADNGVGLHYVDDKLFKIVSTRANANAYRVTRTGDKVFEEVLKAEMLPK
jgi:dipeptidase E